MARRRNGSIALLILGILCVLFGLVVGAIALDSYLDPFDDQPFDPEAWAAADAQGRGPMARDAMRHVPPGTPAAEVRRQFGEPERVPGLRGNVDGFGNEMRHPETWSYWIGSWSSLSWYGLDSAFLYIHFGPDGTVVEAEITGG